MGLPQNPKSVRACVFDAYGTLLDFASAAEQCRDVLGDQTEHVTQLWRDKQLQYTWLRTLQGTYADFWQVTQDALDFSLETLGIQDQGVRTRLLDLYRELDCFDEVSEVLSRLKARGLTLAILSNGTREMIATALTHAGIAERIDHVLTIEAVRHYKTHPAVYQLATDTFNCAAGEIAFVSSNAWDAHAAAAFGMHVIWCNRSGQVDERLPGAIAHRVRTLKPLPDLLCAPPPEA